MKNNDTLRRIVACYVADKRQSRQEINIDINELWYLVKTLGNAGVYAIYFQKGLVHPDTYVGKGKMYDIVRYVQRYGGYIILAYGKLTPYQKFFLKKTFWHINPQVEIWDRTDLILEIFEKHASSMVAKLQIHLARLQHMGPTLYGMGHVLSRQGGGIGTRGIGETNTEIMRRHWKREIFHIKKELKKATIQKQNHIQRRASLGLKTISLVGYTNAGKTSLFNALTKKNKPVKNALFATLDSSVGEIFIKSCGIKVLITDTIGFIRNLPPHLIEAFSSTLMESITADLILHVVDSTDPHMESKIDVVEEIFDQLGIEESKVLIVFTKGDKCRKHRDAIMRASIPYKSVFVSAVTGEGLVYLKEHILPDLLQIPNDHLPIL